MFTDFLWYLGAKQQYQRQKELGLAGFIGLLFALFMIFKWDSIFYPLFNALGFVALADKLGLIHDELGIYTFLNIVVVIFYLSLFIALTLFLSILLSSLLKIFGASKLGNAIMFWTFFCTFFPLIALVVWIGLRKHLQTEEGQSSLRYVYSRDRELKPLLNKYLNDSELVRMFRLYEEQAQRENTPVKELTYFEVMEHLNRAVASIEDDRTFLFGYDKVEGQYYILLPNPLPEYASQCAVYDNYKPYNGIYNYPHCDVIGFLKESGTYDETFGFHVASIPVEFKWNSNEKRILPVLSENPKIQLKNTLNLFNFKVDSSDSAQIFEEVAKRDDVQNWIRTAHVMVYFIPTAFPEGTPFAAENRFFHAVKDVPNVDVFYSLYAADLEACKQYFQERGKNWETEWLTKAD